MAEITNTVIVAIVSVGFKTQREALDFARRESQYRTYDPVVMYTGVSARPWAVGREIEEKEALAWVGDDTVSALTRIRHVDREKIIRL